MTAPRQLSSNQSPLEAKMERLLWCYDLFGYAREYPFSKSVGRAHRFDFAWVDQRVAVEVDGGTYKAHGGRHNTDRDREKLNLAAALGWRVLRFSGAMLDRPDECANVIRAALEWRESDAVSSETA